MNQKQLVREISIETGYAQGDIKRVLDALGPILIKVINASDVKDVVEIPGVIRLKVYKTAARRKRSQYNAMLKRDMTVSAKKSQITAKPVLCKVFKDAITREA